MTAKIARRRLLALPIAFCATPASAQLTVFDPTNYAQNVLSASRALQQINQQITALQNQAQSLINEARNLTTLPYSALQSLQAQLRQTQALIQEAKGLAAQVADVEALFQARYAGASVSASSQELITGARERWTKSVEAFHDALKVQAGVVGNLDGSREQVSLLVSASQSAVGALQAAQAGNQLVALQAQQLADLTALLAASDRAQTLEAAQRAAAQDQAREQLKRFLTPGQGYQPGSAKMFNQP